MSKTKQRTQWLGVSGENDRTFPTVAEARAWLNTISPETAGHGFTQEPHSEDDELITIVVRHKLLSLYVDGGKIVDDDRKEYTEAEARALWDAGQVGDFNLSFKRLTTLGFSLAALEQYYAAEEQARKGGKS